MILGNVIISRTSEVDKFGVFTRVGLDPTRFEMSNELSEGVSARGEIGSALHTIVSSNGSMSKNRELEKLALNGSGDGQSRL
jgi:hypothetical protein